MASVKQNPLRKVAEHQLNEHLGELAPQTKEELATSLVRQWLTSDGHAGVVTLSRNYWFRMVRKEGCGIEVGCDSCPTQVVELLRRANVTEEQIPELLHQLTLCQSVRCQTSEGRSLRLRMIPQQRKFLLEPIADEDE